MKKNIRSILAVILAVILVALVGTYAILKVRSKDLQKAAEKYFLGPQNRKSSKPQAYSSDLIAATLKTFLWRFFTQAFKRNCQPDGIKVFPFELSLHDWWIPSDLGFVRL